MKFFLTIAASLFAVFLTACAATGDKPQTAQDLFDRHMIASFGSDKLDAYHSSTVKGTLTIESAGVEAPITVKQMAPASRLMVVEVMGMTANEGCHNDVCWSKQPGQGVRILSGDALAFQRQFSDFYQYKNLDQYYASMEIVPESSILDTVAVRLVRENGDEDRYYFSRETGLIVAAKIQAYTAIGKIPAEATYSEYKDFAGAKLPTVIEETTPLASTTIRVENVTFETLSDADFQRPQ